MDEKELRSYALQNKDKVWVEWQDPWEGADEKGMEVIAPVTYRALVQDCINIERAVAIDADREDLINNDAALLEEFITVNWAALHVDSEG